MATPSQAQAVKSLNKSGGRRRFIFKTFSERLQEVDINVFRSLDPLKSEPSEGSTFIRDCMVQWRELNTAEDFISFYDVMFPRVQTLPLVVLHKELILSELLSRVTMKARLSLKPILMLIGALSRDLLEDFLMFLPRVADSLLCLLENGADRLPEIIEQVFMSWSYIVMHLQKYLVQDIVRFLKVTLKLRYYHKDYVQEFMAEVVSFLLRNAPVEQLIKGMRKVMVEVVKKPLPARKFGVSSLLYNTLRGTSSRFHSRAEQVIRLLLSASTFAIGEKVSQGSDTILEVLSTTFVRLCEEFGPNDLDLMLDLLLMEIRSCVTDECLLHTSRLMFLLISAIQVEKGRKISDYRKLCELVLLLMKRYVTSFDLAVAKHICEIVEKVLQLMLCILDGLHSTNNESVLSDVALQWAPIFELRNGSLLSFIGELLPRDPCIPHIFRDNILSVLNASIETSQEEALRLTLAFCKRMQIQSFRLLDGMSEEKTSRLCSFLQEAIRYWIQVISDMQGDPLACQFCQTELALLWGVLSCYAYMIDIEENRSLLIRMVDILDQLLIADNEIIAGCPRHLWQSLLGAALSSYHQLCRDGNFLVDDTSKFMDLAKRNKLSVQVLVSVANILDSSKSPKYEEKMEHKVNHAEFSAEKAMKAVEIFSESLSHPNKEIRVATLRILRHNESLICKSCTDAEAVEKKVDADFTEKCSVLEILHLIETTPLSISSSRKVTLFISKIHTALTSARMPEVYVTFVLNGVIGILHNRFSFLWDPALECLSVILSKYAGVAWDRFFHFVENYQLMFLMKRDKLNIAEAESDRLNGLVDSFNSFVYCVYDSTPCGTVLSLLLQSLQKISDVVESRSRQIIPLFLKFLGYNDDSFMSVGLFETQLCKGREWKGVLKEWLNLLNMMRNLKSFYRSQFLKEVLEMRILDANDAETQMKVLDCLLKWKDQFLLPYAAHMRNMISSKDLREELARWSLSKDADLIEEHHRAELVPFVIRILIPKVRKLRTLASQKQVSVLRRKAVLGFIAQLEVDELQLFFVLLIKPIQLTLQKQDNTFDWFWCSLGGSRNDFQLVSFLNYFTVDNVSSLSWKKRFGFMQVLKNVVEVFDELRVSPFLDFLMRCVVRVLESCASLQGMNSDGCHWLSNGSSNDESFGSHVMSTTARKQLKDLRSLCLKITSLVLNKFPDHDFSSELWGLFFVSVKPLIQSFKNEGSSSEKPSSLFSCFLAMSRNPKLVSLLHLENNLVPDIFAILTLTVASEAIVSCVLKLIENLLILDSELRDDAHAVKNILIVNLGSLVDNLHFHFVNNVAKRKSVKALGETELTILKLLSKHVKEGALARKFIDILLPLVTVRTQHSYATVEVLQVIRDLVPLLGGQVTGKILNTVYLLLISAGLDVRLSVCSLLDSVAQSDPSVFSVAKLFNELNAASTVEIGELDYDAVLNAYDKISINFFFNVQHEHALLILSQFVYDMSSNELILRQSALRSLLSFVKFSALIIGRESSNYEEMPDAMMTSADYGWSGNCVLRILNKFILKHMGEAMSKEMSVHKEWIELMREMVLKLPVETGLNHLMDLCSEDAEQDFFNNITHLQKYRRGRALLRFKAFVHGVNLSESIMNKIFVPLFWNMLFDIQDGKGEHVRVACLDVLASISGLMKWSSYYALLLKCLKEMDLKPEKQKLLLRLLCSILDHFHFAADSSNQEGPDFMIEIQNHGTYQSGFSSGLNRCDTEHSFAQIQNCLQKTVLPKIQKLLDSDSDKVNVNANLAALKLLKLLPGDIIESQLETIIRHICNFLKSHLESVRDEARSALVASLKELGLEYLQSIVSILKATLKRGFELHVLGYTVNFILSSTLCSVSGKLDNCVDDLFLVAEKDIFGNVAEEKDVEKIASKMKETRKNKSFETVKLIAQSITFRSHALKLLSPVAAYLREPLTQKRKSKLQATLNSMAAGIECNPTVDLTDLFLFVYGLIKDGIAKETQLVNNTDENLQSLVGSESQCSHLVTVFALGILHNRIKSKVDKKEGELLSMLDPFVQLLGDCLSSKYEDVLAAAIRCLIPLTMLPLPALECQANKIKATLLDIVQCSTDMSSPLCQSCLRLLTVLLRSTNITLSTDQLKLLVQFPLFLDLERNPSFAALSLLKAIVNRRLVVHDVYDLVTQVAHLMVKSQEESIRRNCSQILLKFLLDYQLSEKRLKQHLDFLLENLSYEHPTGRESVLEMLHAIIKKFPIKVVNEQSWMFFLHLVKCLANDCDNKIRAMCGVAIKHLIGRIDSLEAVVEYSLSSYIGSEQQLWSVAAQVLGLLVEAMGKGFQKYVGKVLPAARNMMQLTINSVKGRQIHLSNEAMVPFWKEAYYSLVMFEKILNQFSGLCFERDLEDIWEAVAELLLHPHMWLRNRSNHLLAFYFHAVAEVSNRSYENLLDSLFLIRPSRLFATAASLCFQLTTQLPDDSDECALWRKGSVYIGQLKRGNDDYSQKTKACDDAAQQNKETDDADVATSVLIETNIVFAICGLHSLLGRKDCVDTHTFLSTLEQHDLNQFLKAFQLLGSRKGNGMFASFQSSVCTKTDQEASEECQFSLVSCLLKRLGKIALQKEAIQMKIVFRIYKRIALEIGEAGVEHFAIEMLHPLYKVCEGFSGKVISDDVKLLAQEVSEVIRNKLGTQKFVQLYNQIRKNLKAKRDKRKQGEKLMAVNNPVRNAKRKLKLAQKHRAHKKRKLMTLKMGRWMR